MGAPNAYSKNQKFLLLFLFFFISNKDIYSRTLPYAEGREKSTKGKEREERKRKEKILITQEKSMF